IPNQVPGCTVTVEDTEPVSIKPYGSKETDIVVTSEKTTLAGTKTIPLLATLESIGKNYTFNFEFNINQYFGVELSADKSIIHTKPGEEIKYDISIQNMGNGEDTYTIMIEGIPAHWTINFPKRDSITIKPFGTTNRTLYISIPTDEPYHEVDMEVRVVSTSDSRTNARMQLTTAIEEEVITVLGMSLETFGILILVIIIIIIALGLIRRSAKKKKERPMSVVDMTQDITESKYTYSSDGSRVEWVESSKPMPVQYNPPTPTIEGQYFEVQVNQPSTYRSQTHFPSKHQPPAMAQTPHMAPAQTFQYYDVPGLPPGEAKDDLTYKAPTSQVTQPTTTDIESAPKMSDIDDYDYLDNEAMILEQLDAELAAETMAMDAMEVAEVEAEAPAEVTDTGPANIMEYHESDEFSLSFKRPEPHKPGTDNEEN
ncbi:COG1470 family protein, partial [[Eubacterium] cellulosolvens]